MRKRVCLGRLSFHVYTHHKSFIHVPQPSTSYFSPLSSFPFILISSPTFALVYIKTFSSTQIYPYLPSPVLTQLQRDEFCLLFKWGLSCWVSEMKIILFLEGGWITINMFKSYVLGRNHFISVIGLFLWRNVLGIRYHWPSSNKEPFIIYPSG